MLGTCNEEEGGAKLAGGTHRAGHTALRTYGLIAQPCTDTIVLEGHRLSTSSYMFLSGGGEALGQCAGGEK